MNDPRLIRDEAVPVRRTRISRRALLAAGGASLLAGCGGGGGTAMPQPGEPAIERFVADPPAVSVGESTELVVAFRGGVATLWPQNMTVEPGSRVSTGASSTTANFTLRVRSPSGSFVESRLTVPVSFRNRYATAAPFVASEHTATLATDGAVIVIGGSRGMSTSSDSIVRFDPVTRSFADIGRLASGRATHRATRLTGGGILVTGGNLSQVDGRMVERVDDLTGRSASMGAMSVSRIYHAAIELADGRVLVTGGNATGENVPAGISRSAEIWDAVTQRFRRLSSPMQMGRTAHSMTLLPDGRVLVVGGYAPPGPYVFAEIFDPANETFTPLSAPEEVRASHVAHLVGDRVLIVGGERPGADGVTPVPLATVLGFDAATGKFTPLPNLREPRTWAASVALETGSIFLFGGQGQMSDYAASAERYAPETGGQGIAPLDAPRALHSATRLADGRILLLGGEGVGGAYRSTTLLYE